MTYWALHSMKLDKVEPQQFNSTWTMSVKILNHPEAESWPLSLFV